MNKSPREEEKNLTKNHLFRSLRYLLDHKKDLFLVSKEVSEDLLPNLFSVQGGIFPGIKPCQSYREGEDVFFFRFSRKRSPFDCFSLGSLPFRPRFFTGEGDLSSRGEKNIHWLIREEKIPVNALEKGKVFHSLDFYVFLSNLAVSERLRALARFLAPDPGEQFGDFFPLEGIASLGICQEKAIKKLSRQAKGMGFVLSFDSHYLQLQRN